MPSFPHSSFRSPQFITCFEISRGGRAVATTAGRIISGTRELPLDAMHDRALRAARGLQQLGVGHGDAIAVYMRNDFPFFEAAYAANRLGAYLVPINWHFSAPEVAYILEDSSAKVLITHADLIAPIREH